MNSVPKAADYSRSEMTNLILMEQLAALKIASPTVLAAMARVPRENFVPAALRHLCYHDSALPIGQGQTISQPRIVAMMTEALQLDQPQLKVLEIGTGSGYQTAILAELVRKIYTIERHGSLQSEALERLQPHIKSTKTILFNRVGDGSVGWAEMAPFDRIIVTAAAFGAVPVSLLAQLASRGVMVIPVSTDSKGLEQRLLRISRPTSASDFKTEDLGKVQFVPLVTP